MKSIFQSPKTGKNFAVKDQARPILGRIRKYKHFASAMMLVWMYELVFPTVSWALSGGPVNPDFASFEPVATTNMVNEFSGQFVYNIPVIEIPGASGGGYAMSLSYHSGDGPEEDASWVGYGWTLNPGCINRTNRGLPDDYKNKQIKYFNQVPKNWTLALTGVANVQALSILGSYVGKAGSQTTVRYNNYKGFSLAKNVYITFLNGTWNWGYHFTGGKGKHSSWFSPGGLITTGVGIVSRLGMASGSKAGMTVSKILNSSAGQSMINSQVNAMHSSASAYRSYSDQPIVTPFVNNPFESWAISGSFMVTGDPAPFIQAGGSLGGIINYSYQKNKHDGNGYRNVRTYGYMYSGNAPTNNHVDSAAVMDYSSERFEPFNLQDAYTPIPSSTPDAFYVSGEGLGGAFRMYNDKIGIFSPNYTTSTNERYNFGFDLHVGMSWGFGMDIGSSSNPIKSKALKSELAGQHSLEQKSSWFWGDGNTRHYQFATYGQDNSNEDDDLSEPVFFRFNNDLGGSVRYDDYDNDEVLGTRLDLNNNQPYLQEDMGWLRKDEKVPLLRRSGRSSYVGFHTVAQLRETSASGKRLYAYEKDEKVLEMAGVNERSNIANDLIGEISTVNEDGNQYVYGLPVYGRDESQMLKGLATNTSQSRYVAIGDISSNNTKVGQINNNPYITSYLLTQITTPDYIDVNLNGPDDADYGGYTKFIYKQVHASNGKANANSMFKWRVPFKGVYYHPGRISDAKDNTGSYQSGYKEIYALDTIETKTHFAVFITEDRDDGHSAHTNDELAAEGETYEASTFKKIKKLRQINLYAKPTNGGNPELIKTVHFQYDYTAWPNLPNHQWGTDPHGKLTLKRVWFEYNGVVNAKISPYEFEYTYPDVDYPSKYQYIKDEMTNSSLEQTPDYTPNIDCWGKYQRSGQDRRDKYMSWVTQKPAAQFDPAVWQLKRIILPSGGEIHVQYEENTYSYVQDRPSCQMVSLLNENSSSDNNYAKTTRFYLNLNDIDINASSTTEKQELVDLIKKTYMSNNKFLTHMYYKFFYSLKNRDADDITSCDGDYIDGFAKVTDVGISSGRVYIDINKEVPYEMCIDYIRNEVGGKLMDGNCTTPNGYPTDPTIESKLEDFGEKGKNLAMSFIRSIATNIKPEAFYCKALNPDLSYLRIPCKKKRGGGVRVKRLMMYNKGVDTQSETLYGTEYVYENAKTGESYGVATNEPYENSEENPLVDYIGAMFGVSEPREGDQKDGSTYHGRDEDQFRGPFSMNLLPAPSIGYSRVIKKSLHQDKYTGTGYTVVDYHTVKEYPFDGYYPSLGKSAIQLANRNREYGSSNDIHLFSFDIESDLYSVVDYAFLKNDMHGQLKSVSDYSGQFTNDFFEPDKFFTPVKQIRHDYYQPGEKIPMMNYADYSVEYKSPAKESDITIERRASVETSEDFMLSWDVVNIFSVSGIAMTNKVNTHFGALTTNKVTHYPAIKKSTTILKDGRANVTDYLGFDPLTTKPVVTTTYDGYYNLKNYTNPTFPHNEAYTQYDFPASSQYQEMGQKAWNENHYYYPSSSVICTVAMDTGGYFFVNSMDSIKTYAFNPGDLIAINIGGSIGVANVTETPLSGPYGVNRIRVKPAMRYNSSISTGTVSKIEIIRSAYTNQLNASAGGYLKYGSLPFDTVTTPSKTSKKKSRIVAVLRINDSIRALINRTGSPDTTTISLMDIYDKLIHWDYMFPCSYANVAAQRIYKVKIYRNSSGAYYTTPCDSNGNSLQNPHTWTGPGMHYTAFAIATFPLNYKAPIGYALIPFYMGGTYGPIPNTIFQNQFHGVNGTWSDLPYQWCNGSGGSGDGGVGTGVPGDNYEIYDALVKANVTNYSDNWDYNEIYEFPYGFNMYESGRKGKWRPSESYIFIDTTIHGSNPAANQRAYKYAGVSPNFLNGPWIQNPYLQPEYWKIQNTITQYSPNGHALEEKTFRSGRDIFTSSKYGYFGMLPYIVTKNAQYNSTRFESFENKYIGNKVEDDVSIINTHLHDFGHTGKRCYEVFLNETLKFDSVANPSRQGSRVRFWLKISKADSAGLYSALTIKANNNTVPYAVLARTGEWVLYEANDTTSAPKITYSFKKVSMSIEQVIMDDIRITPYNSQVKTYVYDVNTFKISAVLDDQHFATYYQYNGEGKLVRKKVETERGVRVVDETQYHVPLRTELRNIGVY